MKDNPSLSESIIKRYEALYLGAFYERFVLGKWVAVDGLVYPFFNEKEHIAYSDTLSRALSHPGIYISDIMRDKQEQLVSFVDSTGTVRSAHFRKDGSLRITEDQRILTLEDTRRIKGVKWTSVQKQ